MTPLPRVTTGLRHHRLDNQVLVYDSLRERVHLLDPTTACVLELLEEGGWTREGIAAELSARLELPSSDALLPLALDELRNSDLLEDGAPEPGALIDTTRRELLKKIAVGGVATLLVPAIATLSASSAYAATLAALCSPCGGANGACAAPYSCASGVCVDKTNQQPSGGTCITSGSSTACTQNCDCCTGNCHAPSGSPPTRKC